MIKLKITISDLDGDSASYVEVFCSSLPTFDLAAKSALLGLKELMPTLDNYNAEKAEEALQQQKLAWRWLPWRKAWVAEFYSKRSGNLSRLVVLESIHGFWFARHNTVVVVGRWATSEAARSALNDRYLKEEL